MNEMDILKQIMDSADDIEVPESLKPENIEKKLKSQNNLFQKKAIRYTEVAAALLCVTIGSYAVSVNMKNNANKANAVVGEQMNLAMSNADEEICYEKEKAGFKAIAETEEMPEMEQMEEMVEMEPTQTVLSDDVYEYILLSHSRVEIREKDKPEILCAVIEPENPSLYIEEIRLDGDVLELISSGTDEKILYYDITDRKKPLYLQDLSEKQ